MARACWTAGPAPEAGAAALAARLTSSLVLQQEDVEAAPTIQQAGAPISSRTAAGAVATLEADVLAGSDTEEEEQQEEGAAGAAAAGGGAVAGRAASRADRIEAAAVHTRCAFWAAKALGTCAALLLASSPGPVLLLYCPRLLCCPILLHCDVHQCTRTAGGAAARAHSCLLSLHLQQLLTQGGHVPLHRRPASAQACCGATWRGGAG